MALQTFNAYSQTDVGVLGNPFGAGGKSFVHCGSNPVATIVVKDDDARLDVPQGTSSRAQITPERGELLVSINGDTTHAGQDITSSVRFAVTGSDGSSFDAQVVTAQDATGYLPIGIGGSSFGGHEGASYFVFGQDLIEGVTYSFSPVIAIGQVDDALIEKQVACFTSGTLIKTQQGDMPIEELCEGDMVLTMDRGYQPIRWIGSFKRSAQGDLAPILVRKGALGNDRDLRVSPQHRMLLQGWQAEMFFEEQEVLISAKSLVNDHSIIREEGGEVEYFHMLFDTHEIIWAEGALSESFHPGEEGWNALEQATRNEILAIFPQLAVGGYATYGAPVRTSLKPQEGDLLGEYMATFC